MPTSSSSRVAIVTGAAGDIGKVIATRLASDGFALALSDLPGLSVELEAIVAEITGTGQPLTQGKNRLHLGPRATTRRTCNLAEK